ncbi:MULTISPECIES: DUF3309 family protein [Rhizobium]|nr:MULTISPECIES: DUF3309 family protein [Rhizobium]ANL02687.1 hypothetical protein AMJ99_CH01100 [Rhizobium esperanzae]ANM33539.1 hypothetical protein AMK04_CH01101 [Rhizobium sp. N871]
MLGTILLIILILLLAGCFHFRSGPWPSGGIGVVIAVLIILILLGKV